MARVLLAMSGGVDSSVAAAVLLDAGHDVVGATMKLWGGESDTGCCSVSDVEDARRVAQQVGIDHHVFNFTEEFGERVVAPYVAGWAAGRTPNPCIECNRHLKFDRLLSRARMLGFDAVATGHHARVVERGGRRSLCRGVDAAKDQSYVLAMLTEAELGRVLLPIGDLTKAEVRRRATALGLRTAAKPDSQDVCFVSRDAGRAAFLGARIPLRPGRVVDSVTGAELGTVPAVELVTIGQRRGLSGGGGAVRYALDVDLGRAVVTAGPESALATVRVDLDERTWTSSALAAGTRVTVQCSAHGEPVAAVTDDDGVAFDSPRRRVAPGQTVALYVGDEVVGSGVAR